MLKATASQLDSDTLVALGKLNEDAWNFGGG
jgi:hypothetical protein